jgi:hypothetical protein
MKKTFMAVLMVLFVSSFAWADWEVTVSGWTMSIGPDLAYEEVRMDGVAKCTNILPADSKACVFIITAKTNQEITIRSFDSATSYADNTIGNIGTGPNPSTGGTITVIWK